MDRRIVAGMVGLALVGSSQTSNAQVRDPSSAGTVGYSPLEPLSTDRLNSTNPTARAVPASVPTDPTATGPEARVPTPPVGPTPVGLTPQPALADSLDNGYPTSGLGWFGRRRAAAAARKATRTNPPATAQYDPSTVPAGMAWDESGQNPAALATGLAGRPAPFVDEVPDSPRPQSPTRLNTANLAGDGSARLGRPAPFASEQPTKGRPRLGVKSPATATPQPRPQSTAATGQPRGVAAGPAPLIPTTLPDLEPATPAAALPTQLPALDPLPDRLTPAPSPREPASTLPPAAEILPLAEPPQAPPAALPDLAPAAASLPDLAPTVPPTGPLPDLAPATSEPGALPDLAPLAPAGPAPGSAALPSPAGAPVAAIPPRPVQPDQVQLTAVAAAPTPTTLDSGLRRTSVEEPTAIRIDKNRDKDRPFASARAAAVGDTVITVHQVESLVVDKYKDMTKSGEFIPEQQRRELINALGVMALDHLIDQNLILQEFKRRKLDVKMKKQFDEFANKKWHDDKLPGLLRTQHVNNEYELAKKLADEGQSYAEMQEAFRRDMLEHDFLFNELRNKISVDMVHLKAYYNQHLHDYDQPARLSWRDIEINISKYPDRAAALRQAEGIAARLRKEDFAAVAQTASDGPTASQGGLYADMTPGSYGSAPVNAALSDLPIGVVSPVIEDPTTLHVLRVESRRSAGPLRFDEVQKRVADEVFQESFLKAREQYLAKLRSHTLVRVMPMFERAKARDLERQRRDEGQVIPASNR